MDVWSIGVILYACLVGTPPFQTSDVRATYKRIRAGAYEFPKKDDGSGEHLLSSDARDLIATCLFQSFWILESVADQQQWEFQQSKHRARGHPRIAALEEDYRRGFLTSGLFRLSRHPNFFAEQALWCSFYLFSVAASCQSPTEVAALFRAPVDWRAWVNWSATGAALLVALFQGSTPFTESITRGKYASYAAYQKTTSRLVPWFPARGKQISSTGAAATGTVITATGERKSTRARKPRKLED